MEDTFAKNYTVSKSKGDELGTKSSEILLKLGFIDSVEKKRKYSIGSEHEDDSIYNLEFQAFQCLNTCVEIVCMMDKKDVENFYSFNDLM